MSSKIYSIEDPVLRAQIPAGIPLVLTVRAMNDAGGVIAQLDNYFEDRCAPQPILRFIADELIDYRSRRPIITFTEDHFTDYEPETLTLSLARDDMGAPFLVLSGFEPDLRWDEFIDTLLQLIHEFSVSSVVWAHAIPMPVPHTRPIRMTVSGSRDDLIESYSVWKPTSKLPASISHVLEYRLHQLGEEVVGFALLVPHYLANTEYPDGLLTALESFMAVTGLLFAIDSVREESVKFTEQVNTQLGENDESLEMVKNLEQRYDEYIEQQNQPDATETDPSTESVTQLMSELEKFLAQERQDFDDDLPNEQRADGEPPTGMQ